MKLERTGIRPFQRISSAEGMLHSGGSISVRGDTSHGLQLLGIYVIFNMNLISRVFLANKFYITVRYEN